MRLERRYAATDERREKRENNWPRNKSGVTMRCCHAGLVPASVVLDTTGPVTEHGVTVKKAGVTVKNYFVTEMRRVCPPLTDFTK